MYRTSAIIFVVVLLGLSNGKAAELEGNWAMQISSGLGITVSPADKAGDFPYSFATSAELIYMVNDYFGLVPVALSYKRMGFDRDRFADVMSIPVSALDKDAASAWLISYTPGIYFEFPTNSKVRFFTLVCAGIYHSESSVTASSINYRDNVSENNFGFQNSAGIEFSVSSKAAIVARVKSVWVGKPSWNWWFFDKDESTKYFDISCGMKLYF